MAIRLTEEDSTVFEQARDYHNMMVRLIRQARLYRFAAARGRFYKHRPEMI